MSEAIDSEAGGAELDFSAAFLEKWARAPELAGVDILRHSPLWSEEDAGTIAQTIAHCRPLILDDLPAEAEFSVALCDDAEIRRLNRLWRGKDAPTNVLSFPSPEGPQADFYYGDLALAYETVRREAEEAGKPFAHHLAHLVIHGILHLAGFDHQTDDEAEYMERLEAKLLASMNIPDPYDCADLCAPQNGALIRATA